MKLTAADVFYVITGFPVPENVLPKAMQKQTLGLEKVTELLCGEKVRAFQIERVRQECKIWLFKKHVFLMEWNLSHDILMTPGAIEWFFKEYALKHSHIEVESLPSNFHVSIDPFEEKQMLELNEELRNIFSFKKPVRKKQ